MKRSQKQTWKRRAVALMAIFVALAMVLSLAAPFFSYGIS